MLHDMRSKTFLVSLDFLYKPEDDLFKLLNAARLWISLGRRLVAFSATLKEKDLTLCFMFPSASSQCLSPLRYRRATVTNVSLEKLTTGFRHSTNIPQCTVNK